ncbi:MAG: hypothetical protein RI906_2129 [Pseudomonadota bacterium]|jgi:hypothetical protein
MDTLNGLDLIIWFVTLTSILYILAPIVAAGVRFLRTATIGSAQPAVMTSSTVTARDAVIVSNRSINVVQVHRLVLCAVTDGSMGQSLVDMASARGTAHHQVPDSLGTMRTGHDTEEPTQYESPRDVANQSQPVYD